MQNLLLLLLCASSSNTKTKSLFIYANNSGFDRYLFQLIVLSKSDFNYGNNFALYWVDKVAKLINS